MLAKLFVFRSVMGCAAYLRLGACKLAAATVVILSSGMILLAVEPAMDAQQSSRRWVSAALADASPNGALDPLGAHEIGCEAAKNWQPSAALRQRAQTVIRQYCDDCEKKRQAASAMACFLQLQASHQQDIGAGTAMRAYYSRIAISLQQALISVGQKMVDEQSEKQDLLLQQGVAAALDLTSLHRQRIDLQDSSLQAMAKDEQLRNTLYALTNLDYDHCQCAVEPLTVLTSELHCQCLVDFAMRNRCDLHAWQYLCSQVNEDTAPMFVSLLMTSITGYGIPVPVTIGLRKWLCSCDDQSNLAESMRQELSTVIRANQRWIEETVLTKCSELRLAYQRLELEQQRMSSWRKRLDQLERLESLGQAKPDERAAAQAGYLRSQTEEVQRKLDAKLAEIALSETVGGLSGRCCQGLPWLITGVEGY